MKYLISLYRLFFAAIICFSISSCLNPKSDDDDMDIEIELGAFSLKESSVTDFPYQSDSTIVFVDSMGNERFLFLSVEPLTPSSDLQLLQANGPNVTTYNFTTEVKRYVLKNDSFDIRFELELSARPYAADPESGLVADVLNITAKDFFSQLRLILFNEWDLRTWPNKIGDNAIESIEINGVTFTDVYQASIEEPFMQLYFSRNQGIVSYTDQIDVIWTIK